MHLIDGLPEAERAGIMHALRVWNSREPATLSCHRSVKMSDPYRTVSGANRRRDPQEEVGFSSWTIVGVFALAVIGLAFSTMSASRSDRTPVVANRSIAPAISMPAPFEDETTGQAAPSAR